MHPCKKGKNYDHTSSSLHGSLPPVRSLGQGEDQVPLWGLVQLREINDPQILGSLKVVIILGIKNW